MHPLARYYKVLWAPRTWSGIAYLALGLPLSIAWFVYAVTMLATGASLVIVWVGLPLLVVTVLSLRWIGAFERVLLNSMGGTQIEAPAPLRRTDRGSSSPVRALRWSRDVLHDGVAWRALAWIGVRFVLAPLGFTAAILATVLPVSLVGALLQAFLVQMGWGGWSYDADAESVVHTVSFWTLAGSPLVIAMLPMFGWAVGALMSLHRTLGHWALGPSEAALAAEATARAELAEEQVRIDQELHDSIGHMITMNVVQAGAGAHVFDTDPEFARQALKNIEERGRAAMGELDRIIATIRGDRQETRVPLPGIADIERLVETSRAAGLAITSEVDAPGVPNALGRAAFAVVREALTNAAKHAPGADASVAVVRMGETLTIAVVNGEAAPGSRPSTGATSRRGVAGMRDRIELLGGKQRIGATDRGFEVLAVLPLGPSLERADQLESWWDTLREKVSP